MAFGRFLPQEHGFFDLFERHAEMSVKAAMILVEGLDDLSDVQAMARSIKDVEHEGDKITHETVEKLRKTFITPIDRDEIHRLISRLDDVLDFLDAAAQRFSLYEITEAPPEAKELADVLLRATREIQSAVRGLRTLKNPMEMLKSCVEINRLENEGDNALRRGMARLFKEKAHDPIAVIKWKELYEFLESATDSCEDVANIIEGVVLEHS